jgi:hypothetical protein
MEGATADTLLERWVAPGTVFVPVALAAVVGAVLLARQRSPRPDQAATRGRQSRLHGVW